MLQLILANPQYRQVQRPDWQSVLDMVVPGDPYHALIDAGALMAGASNAQVAEYLLGKLDRREFSGVVFFDPERSEWVVQDFNLYAMSTSKSPIAVHRSCTRGYRW